jgi:hypothetical protein
MLNRIRIAVVASCILCAPFAICSCSSQESTTQRTVSTNYSDPDAPPTTTTTTTTTDNEPDSVVGSTLHAVGTIILFPFRLVGDAIGLIV